jgi:acetate kinase
VFTGGIGENAASIRARVCRHAAWLGVELNEHGNAKGGPQASAKSSRVVILTNEDLMIARHTRSVLGFDRLGCVLRHERTTRKDEP